MKEIKGLKEDMKEMKGDMKGISEDMKELKMLIKQK